MSPDPGPITTLLRRIGAGDQLAQSELVSLIYDELRRIAKRQLFAERPGHTLQPSDLVSELYIRLRFDGSIELRDRRHLFAVVATNMRRILVDHARSAGAQRRPPPVLRVELEEIFARSEDHPDAFLIAAEALDQLAQFSPRQARIVELRYFAGLTIEEIAPLADKAERTVKRDLQMAMAWLSKLLNDNRARAAAAGLNPP